MSWAWCFYKRFGKILWVWYSWVLKVYFLWVLGNIMHDVLNGILDILFMKLLKVIFLWGIENIFWVLTYLSILSMNIWILGISIYIWLCVRYLGCWDEIVESGEYRMSVWCAVSTTLCTSPDVELGYGDLRYLELSEPGASLTGCCCRPLIG